MNHRFAWGLLSGLVIFFCTSTAWSAAPTGAEHKHQHQGMDGKPAAGVSFPDLRSAQFPSATFDHNGRLWLAWIHGPHVYVNHSDDQGNSVSEPVVVNTRPEGLYGNGEARPKIAVDREGRVFVAWTQKLEKRFTGHIRFSRSLDGGESFSRPLIINDNQDMISHRFESMLVDDTGRIHLTWLDGRDAEAAKRAGSQYDGSALYYASSDDHGETFSANRLLAANTCQCCRLGMALDTENRPVVMWRHVFVEDRDGSRTVARDHGLMAIGENGQAGELRRVSFENWATDSCPHHGPALGADPQGRMHMTWFNQQGGKPVLAYGWTDDLGGRIGGFMQLNKDDPQAQHPYVAVQDQRVILAWKSFDGKQTRVQVRQSDDRGNSFGPVRTVAQAAGASDHPLLITGAGRVWLSWSDAEHGWRLIEVAQQ